LILLAADRVKNFLDRNGNSEEARTIVEGEMREIELYEKYKAHYSYGIYIAKKISSLRGKRLGYLDFA